MDADMTMSMSTPLDHVHMVGRGWDHAALMAMDEDEFGFWRAEQDAYDKIVAEAQAKAAKPKGGRRRGSRWPT